MNCPYCNKIITMCVPLITLLASGIHKIFCQNCNSPIIVTTKEKLKISSIEKGFHQKESYHSLKKGEYFENTIF